MSDDSTETAQSKSTGVILLLVACALLVWWKAPGFVDDIRLFIYGETTTATIDRKETVARNDVYNFYFLASGDTVRNVSKMFGPLMAMTSKANEDDLQTFKVVYTPSETERNYPRASLRIHFFFSLLILLIALLLLLSVVNQLRSKG